MATGNLEFVDKSTSTSVSAHQVNGVFTTDYDIYQVNISKIDKSNNAYDQIRFVDETNTVISTTNYEDAQYRMFASGTRTESKSVNATSISELSYSGSPDSNGIGVTFYVFNPTNTSTYTFLNNEATGYYSGGLLGIQGTGVLKTTDDIRGIYIFPTSGTYESITTVIYGIKK